jgi:hypothetical protein
VTRAAGAAVLVALLAACSSSLAGNALSAGSTTVSDSELSALVTELRDQLAPLNEQNPFDPATVTASNVDRLMRSALLEEAARREGIVVTQGEVDNVIRETAKGNFGGDLVKLQTQLAEQQNVPASQVPSFARDFLLQAKLGQKLKPGGKPEEVSAALVTYLSALSTDIGAEVAPRFGTWDASSVSLSPVPDDLSGLPVEAAPAATQ